MWVRYVKNPDSTIWPRIDPASVESLRSTLQAQEQRIQSQDEKTNAALQQLACCATRQENALAELSELAKSLSQESTDQSPPIEVPAAYSPALDARLGPPMRFTGMSGDCRPFLTQCEIHFELHAPSFPTKCSKVAYAVSHLTGEAKAWATAERQNKSSCTFMFESFSKAMKQIFQLVSPG